MEEERLLWSQNAEEKSVIIEQLERELEATVDALHGDPSKHEQVDEQSADKEFGHIFRNNQSKSVYASWDPVDFAASAEQTRSFESHSKSFDDYLKSDEHGSNQSKHTTDFATSNHDDVSIRVFY